MKSLIILAVLASLASASPAGPVGFPGLAINTTVDWAKCGSEVTAFMNCFMEDAMQSVKSAPDDIGKKCFTENSGCSRPNLAASGQHLAPPNTCVNADKLSVCLKTKTGLTGLQTIVDHLMGMPNFDQIKDLALKACNDNQDNADKLMMCANNVIKPLDMVCKIGIDCAITQKKITNNCLATLMDGPKVFCSCQEQAINSNAECKANICNGDINPAVIMQQCMKSLPPTAQKPSK